MRGVVDQAFRIPCGQCIGCRLERSRQWAIRCIHEASLYERNCFITLTYATDHLPPNGTLVTRDWQLFMKRLRKAYGPRIRFFACGEYGPKLGRPHYHACLFNFRFDDLCDPVRTKSGELLYRSPALANLWGMGHVSVGDVTFQSAAYVARYVCDKITGEAAEAHYQGRKPEFLVMSRKPGIGRGWLDKFQGDIYPRKGGGPVINGHEVKPPRYYDLQYEIENPDEFQKVKAGRRGPSDWIPTGDKTSDRLKVRNEVTTLRVKRFTREVE